jgi:hypothetical protein
MSSAPIYPGPRTPNPRWRVLLVVLSVALGLVQYTSAHATIGSSHGLSNKLGIDGCQSNGNNPSPSQLLAWWSPTNYFDVYFYMGPSNLALCGPGGTNQAWVDQVTAQGWSVVPIWVARIGNCSTSATHVSCTTSTAASQGNADARAAYQAWIADGFSGNSVAPLLDVEAYSNTATNRAAMKAYVNAWVSYFHTGIAQIAGVYGSSCASYITDFATIANPPDSVGLAAYNGTASVWGIPCVADAQWYYNQRYHQYKGTHTETHGGVSLSIDSDCADAQVAPTGHSDGNSGYGPTAHPSCI